MAEYTYSRRKIYIWITERLQNKHEIGMRKNALLKMTQ